MFSWRKYPRRSAALPGVDLPSLWASVVSAAASNPEVMVPSPRKWVGDRLKMAQKIHEYLDGDWGPLVEAVKCATVWGAPCRLDLSLERLSSHDCRRLDDLISGRWRREESRAKVAEKVVEEANRETLREIVESKRDAVLDHKAALAALRGKAGV